MAGLKSGGSKPGYRFRLFKDTGFLGKSKFFFNCRLPYMPAIRRGAANLELHDNILRNEGEKRKRCDQYKHCTAVLYLRP